MNYPYQATQESTVNYKALGITIVLHALLLLLFLSWRYSLPVPVINAADMGMEVNLGSDADGLGTKQAQHLGSAATDNAIAVTANNNTQANNKDMLTGTDAAAPTVNTPKTAKLKTIAAATANPGKSPQQAKYVYSGNTAKGGNNALQNVNGSSEGITNGPGDAGVPGGTPGATNYTGAPGTGGISHTLNGRFIVEYPGREAEYTEDGRVVIRITVNPEGYITKTQVLAAATEELRQIALKKCAKVRFNSSQTAPGEQFGNITFVFRSHS